MNNSDNSQKCNRSLNSRRTLMVAVAAVLCLTALSATPAEAGETTTIVVEDYGFTFAVPAHWQNEPCHNEVSMKLHFVVPPVDNITGHFSVHVMDRGSLDIVRWAAFHRKENISAAYGTHRIELEIEAEAGRRQALLFYVTDLEGRPEFGLWEALVVTESHAIFFSYLHDLKEGMNARTDMNTALSAFGDSPEEMERARSWYREGRTLGIEKAGLFLSLPLGWIPTEASRRETPVALPSGGTLRVLFFTKVRSGFEGLRKLLSRKIDNLPNLEEFESLSFGESLVEALRFRKSSAGGEARACVLGLNGKCGFALVIESGDFAETALLEKMLAKALLLDPRKAESMRREAVLSLKRALRKKDLPVVEKALATLVFFSQHSTTVPAIGEGLKSTNEIQLTSIAALGRMGTIDACALVAKTLAGRKVCDTVKLSCVEALDRSRRGKEAIQKMARKEMRNISPSVRQTMVSLVEGYDQNGCLPR
jgi:hypothetical protein